MWIDQLWGYISLKISFSFIHIRKLLKTDLNMWTYIWDLWGQIPVLWIIRLERSSSEALFSFISASWISHKCGTCGFNGCADFALAISSVVIHENENSNVYWGKQYKPLLWLSNYMWFMDESLQTVASQCVSKHTKKPLWLNTSGSL